MNKFIKLNKKNIFDLKLQNNIFYYWYHYHRLFFHSLIWRGNKIFAFNFFIKIKYELKLRESVDPFLILFSAFTKITPDVALFPFRKSGIVNLIPMPITIKKQITFSIKWIIKLLKDRYRKINLIQLINLIIDSSFEKGIAIEKKKDVYFIASKNKFLLKYLS